MQVDGGTYGSFVAGLHDAAAITEHAGVSHGVQAYLTPLGAERLFRMPMGELANRGADLADLLDDADELAERLYETPGWPARLALLEAYIERRVAEAPQAPREIEWSWQRLLASDGAVPVASLAARSRGLDPEWPPVLIALVLLGVAIAVVSVVVVFRALRTEARGSRRQRTRQRSDRPW